MAAVCTAFTGRQLTRSGMSLSQVSRRTITSTACLRANGSLRDSLMASNASSEKDAANKQPDPSAPKITHRPPPVKKGSLASGSIFAEGDDVTFSPSGRAPTRPSKSSSPSDSAAASTESTDLAHRDKTLLERTLIPHPNRRARWERKMVIRAVKNRGQLSKQELIHQTERELQSRSHFFKTSLKKLGPLARQVAGKNIDDAIVQMKYSKKKAAKDVKAFLEQAKNEAIVSRGMGLGKVQAQEGAEESGVDIKLKDGKAYTVTDETAIYIDQAWVNRGTYGTDYDHRARGQINRLRLPHTALAVILKEDKTRIREWKDRTEKALKERKSKLWVQLPDRKISAQSQYYSW
ncbi:mitochondrial large ribosomal subunit [Arthroderma uncinatum]|uniref:mitochondrial large ribosomal subunit n=1 Tax=Arthroderma uncinatum TaxID=74035 RepID=UPI00144AD39B|nr:mitochondrial large ribosomal subunit [Arthroderma uncinatum]KAF3480001.1 mitochondrial large ribosomal subunit [Arthroderma uncinatum]